MNKENLIDKLNEDLAAELAAIIQYSTHMVADETEHAEGTERLLRG